MAAHVIRVATDGRVWRSLVCFYCDVGRADGRVIPLGAMVETVFPNVHGLGVVGRTKLSDDELKLASEPARTLIRSPFDYISDQFDDAWENAPIGSALAYLAEKHPHSLHFSVPEQLHVPKRFLVSPPNDREILPFMAEMLDDEGYELASPRQRLFEVGEAA